MSAEPVESFRPSSSVGWLWVLALALVMVVPLPLSLASGEPLPPEGRLVVFATFAIVVAIAVWLLVAVAFFRRMRYDFTPDALVISYGPILRYRLPYNSITDVSIANLQFSPWSSFRFPGLALWGVPYGGGTGTVKMCSTRSHLGVLLISAGGQRYGISPAEQDRFMRELASRRERALRAVQG